MAKTKISEFSSTPANNTDIDSINIAEGCAPSGINDAIRELMAQLKDFQTGAVGDSFNGPIGTSTASTGAFTTLSATGAITSTLATGTAPLVIASTTKVANLNVDLLDGADWASPAALGSTTPAAVSATTLAASSTVTLSGGTANGVAYLNGSKVVTSGSALTFDGSDLAVGNAGGLALFKRASDGLSVGRVGSRSSTDISMYNAGGVTAEFVAGANELRFNVSAAEQMRLTSTGLGIGTSSFTDKLAVNLSGANSAYFGNNTSGTTSNTVKIHLAPTNAFGTNWSTYEPAYIGAVNNSGGSDTNLVFATYNAGVTSEKMRLDTSGNLGLGVTPGAYSESSKFTINATGKTNGIYINFNGTGADKQILLTNGGSANCFVGTDNTAMTLGTGNTERARIDSSGNLGLGVTPSADWASSGYKAVVVRSAFLAGGSGVGVAVLGNNAYNDGGGWRYVATGVASYYVQNAGAHSWSYAPSGTAGNAITFTQAMTLDASGVLLVGITSATGVAKLQVSGPLRTTGYTVATLPTGTVGMRTYVTDALAPTFGATVASGGAVTIPVFYNGTNWIVG